MKENINNKKNWCIRMMIAYILILVLLQADRCNDIDIENLYGVWSVDRISKTNVNIYNRDIDYEGKVIMVDKNKLVIGNDKYLINSVTMYVLDTGIEEGIIPEKNTLKFFGFTYNVDKVNVYCMTDAKGDIHKIEHVNENKIIIIYNKSALIAYRTNSNDRVMNNDIYGTWKIRNVIDIYSQQKWNIIPRIDGTIIIKSNKYIKQIWQNANTSTVLENPKYISKDKSNSRQIEVYSKKRCFDKIFIINRNRIFILPDSK